MNRQRYASGAVPSSILPVLAAALAIAIFIADMLTELEIAVAVFYIFVVLMSVRFLRRRGVALVSAGCMALTILAYFLSHSGAPYPGLVNFGISLSAIGVTAYLALKIESAVVTAQEARVQLAHFARVTTLGELTLSIAHEVNQPLTAVVTSGNACLRWLDLQPPNLDKAKQAMQRIVEDASRASEIIRRVRGLARQAPARNEPLSINETIQEILALMKSELDKSDISLRTELAHHLPLLVGDRIQLQQVLLNLIINATEAMKETREAPRELTVSTALGGSDKVVVAVRDTGPGLDQRQLEGMFEPFYTTKHEGMGMGLTISRSIIENHGGRIWATPNDPRGATFQFTLPLGGKEVS
jgi:C4-dicarboxylate-specific signal transduction histidine kinase